MYETFSLKTHCTIVKLEDSLVRVNDTMKYVFGLCFLSKLKVSKILRISRVISVPSIYQ
jgi:hypothetical protein